MPLVHANLYIGMYYSLACITVVYVYFRRNTNHLFRKSVKRYSARFTLFLFPREISYCRKVMKNMKYDNEIR